MHAQAVANTAAIFDLVTLSRLRPLEAGAASHLTAISSLQRKPAGQILFAEGDQADSVYEMVSGVLRLCKLLPDGRRLITGFSYVGQFVGFAPEDIYAYTAEAITDVTVCRYKRSGFDRLIDEVPGFAKRLLTITAHELYAAQDRMLLLGRKSAMEKVASFLLLMADQQGSCDEAAIPMTRNDIADYLGLTVETVCRTLTRLKQDELIAFPALTHLRIRDRRRLEELAAGESGSDF